MSDLQTLPNIGAVLAERLRQAGIESAEALLSLGDTEAFRRLRVTLPDDACLSTRFALAGAVRGMRWHALDATLRKNLTREFKK